MWIPANGSVSADASRTEEPKSLCKFIHSGETTHPLSPMPTSTCGSSGRSRLHSRAMHGKVKKALASLSRRLLQLVLPLLLALYTNIRYLSDEAPASQDALPDEEWAISEASAILARSEDRLETLEGKGPGLATVCAIVATAIGVAVSLTWDESTTLAQLLLVGAAGYGVISLWAPVVLIGPIRRDTVTRATLEEAANEADPAGYLAQRKARAAAVNELTTLRLSNLQAASRRDVLKAILLFVAWGIIALTGHAAISVNHTSCVLGDTAGLAAGGRVMPLDRCSSTSRVGEWRTGASALPEANMGILMLSRCARNRPVQERERPPLARSHTYESSHVRLPSSRNMRVAPHDAAGRRVCCTGLGR